VIKLVLVDGNLVLNCGDSYQNYRKKIFLNDHLLIFLKELFDINWNILKWSAGIEIPRLAPRVTLMRSFVLVYLKTAICIRIFTT